MHEVNLNSHWYRDRYRSYVIYVSDHVYLITRQPMAGCTCDLCRGFRSNEGGHPYNLHEDMLYVCVMDKEYNPNTFPQSVLDRWNSLKKGYVGLECMAQEYAMISHKITTCVVGGEDNHPAQNPLPDAHASSPNMSKSHRRRVRCAISDSGA